MPRTSLAIKYCFLTKNGEGTEWTGNNSLLTTTGTIEEIQSECERVLRSNLNFAADVRCEIEQKIGFYTVERANATLSRKDYKWNPLTTSFDGPDFHEEGDLNVLVSRVSSFLNEKAASGIEVKPAMSLIFNFYVGERDIPVAVRTPAVAAASKASSAAPPPPPPAEEVDDFHPNLFGGDDEW